MRVFLDTNILLDIIEKRAGFVESSVAVLDRCDELQAECSIAWHGLATAYYILKRGRTQAAAMAEVDRILEWADIAPVTKLTAYLARDLGFSDFEDAMQAAAAAEGQADIIVTRNVRDFAASPIPAYTPEQFTYYTIRSPSYIRQHQQAMTYAEERFQRGIPHRPS